MLVQRLLEIISKPVATTYQVDQSRDLLEVHALNILSSVVQESNLTVGVSRYYDTLTVHAVDGFMSSLWTIRNASLRLLGRFFATSVKECVIGILFCKHMFFAINSLFFKFTFIIC